MCALKPIHKSALPHSMTVFNEIGTGARLMAVVIRAVNYADSNAFSFKVTGTNTANSFRVVVDCVNSDFGGREFVRLLTWRQLTEDEQKDGTRCTLYRDMWLFRGEHEAYPDGAILDKADMTPAKFAAHGLALHKTTLFDLVGWDVPHSIKLGG